MLETVALTKQQEAETETAKLNLLIFASGVTRMDRIKNAYV